MKTQVRNRTAENRFPFFAAALIGLGLAITAQATATAGEPAMTTKPPIIAYTKVLKAVEQRPDFGVIEEVRYDPRARAWNFRYMKDDGLMNTVRMDAVTGKPLTMVGEAQ